MIAVTLQEIREYFHLGHVRDEFLIPANRSANDFELRDLLGGEFYDYILSNQSEQNVINLMPYIKPLLCCWTYAYLQRGIDTQVTNSGVKTKQHPESDQTQNKQKQWMYKQAYDKANKYASKLVKYLDANYSQYIFWEKGKRVKSRGIVIKAL